MGVIRVKLANNYDALPADAAASYAAKNKTVKLIAPDDIIAGTWKIASTISLQQGFGAHAKRKDGSWWGFSICFLFNQSTGFTELYENHLIAQNAAGRISDDYLKWWQAGNIAPITGLASNDNSSSIDSAGTFVHPAYLAISRLNEISIQDQMDIDFTYPSPIHQDQPNFYLNDTNSNVAIDKRTMQTSRRTEQNVPGLDPEKNEGFGAYGDNPWPRCSMMSFYATSAFTGANETAIEASIKSAVVGCGESQDGEWNEQWTAINGEEEEKKK